MQNEFMYIALLVRPKCVPKCWETKRIIFMFFFCAIFIYSTQNGCLAVATTRNFSRCAPSFPLNRFQSVSFDRYDKTTKIECLPHGLVYIGAVSECLAALNPEIPMPDPALIVDVECSVLLDT